MVEIARLAKMSPATAYQYFEDVEAMVPAVLEYYRHKNVPLTEHMMAVKILLSIEGYET